MKKLILRSIAILCILALLPMPVAFAYDFDLEVHISSEPGEPFYIPVENMRLENLKLNDIAYNPGIEQSTNSLELYGGDLLIADMLDKDASLLVDPDSDELLSKESIFIRHGKVYLGETPVGTEKAILSASKLVDRANEKARREGTKVAMSVAEAMLRLKGQTFSLKSDSDEINLNIGNVWQAPIPDKDYDPLSQYIPPELPAADPVTVVAADVTVTDAPDPGECIISADYSEEGLSLEPTVNAADNDKWWYMLPSISDIWERLTGTLVLAFSGQATDPDAAAIEDGDTLSIGYGEENNVTVKETITVNDATPDITVTPDGTVTLTKEQDAVNAQSYTAGAVTISTVDDPNTTTATENQANVTPAQTLSPESGEVVTDSGSSTQIDVYNELPVD